MQDADPFSPTVSGPEGAEPQKADLGLRLRPRSKATRSLAYLGACARRWWRDLPASVGAGVTDANLALCWLASYTDGQAKTGRVIRLSTAVGKPPAHVVSVSMGGGHARGELWVCPELVASLSLVRVFRAVGPGLLASLRARARLWCADQGVSDLDASFILPASVVLASLPQASEVECASALRSDAARWSVDVLGPLAKGVAKAPTWLGFWEGVQRALRWVGPSGVYEPTCNRLSLSSE